jgi:hypothetical protein
LPIKEEEKWRPEEEGRQRSEWHEGVGEPEEEDEGGGL